MNLNVIFIDMFSLVEYCYNLNANILMRTRISYDS
jgi:hypothetical protein